MSSNVEQGLNVAIDTLRKTAEERDALVKANRDWEIAYAQLKAEMDLLKGIYADMKVDSDRYKGYAVELRTRLQDINTVIAKAVNDARSQSFPDRTANTTATNDVRESMPKFLKEGPDQEGSRLLLETIPKTNKG